MFLLQGVLDVLMVQGGPLRGDEDSSPPAGNLLAYRQSLSEDHTFLKVLGMHDCNDSVQHYCRSGNFVVSKDIK